MNRRSEYSLKPLKGVVKRKKFCVYDIESKAEDTQDPGFTRPFLVGTYDPQADEYIEFRNLPHVSSLDWRKRHSAPGGCIDRFLNYLLSPRFAGYNIYAHNGGSFDHLFLLAWLTARRDEYGFEVVPTQSSIQQITVWRVPEDPDKPIREKWVFLDSMKLLPMGLDRACKTFGLEGKVEHDLGMHEDDPHWSVYLQQDCFALAEVMQRTHDLIENVLGGEVGMTTPATSMKLFRRKYLGRGKCPLVIPRYAHFPGCKNRLKCPGCAHEWQRRAYYGGRTELFEMYGEGLNYFDINSSYVAAMREEMPAGDREVCETLEWHKLKHNIGFVECTVRIPEDCYLPPLPHRQEKTGKLIFPVGVFSGVWSCDELKLLEHTSVRGEILYVKKVVWYRRKYLFVDMVDQLWSYRDKNLEGYDEGLSALAKLLGNGLYGKFGMKQDRTTVVFARETVDRRVRCFLCGKDKPPHLMVCQACEGSKPANGDPECEVWYQHKHVDASYIIPQIAAHITSLARIRLWRFMREALDAGGNIYYADSVTGDRTTVVKSERGIEVLTFEELWARVKENYELRGKSFGRLFGYQALTEKGWCDIQQVMRHRSGKVTHRISTKHGQTQVTTDHGIMVDGVETCPEDFVESDARFTRVRVPASEPLEVIDLYDFVRDWSFTRSLKLPIRQETLSFTCEGEWLVMRTGWEEARGVEPIKVRRFYPRGSAELHALVRLVSTYVSDGSVSIPGMTTKSRFMLSFCKQHREVMERVARDLLIIAPGLTLTGPLWSETVFVVRSGTITMSCLFAALGGAGSKQKRLPSFFYGLDENAFEEAMLGFREGDAPVDSAGQMNLTTSSQRLAAGYSLLLSQHGLEHSFYFRVDKTAWSIRSRPKGSERDRYSIKDEVFEGKFDEWVYDLTVEGAHTFVDGIGQVLLHNTDSIITDVKLPTNSELGALKDEYPGVPLKGAFIQPKVYMLEAEEGFPEKDKPKEQWKKSKVTMKGFPRDMRTKENLEKLIAGEELEWKRLEKVRTLARSGFEKTPEMVKVKKSLKSKYSKRVVDSRGGTLPLVLDEEPEWLRENAAE